MPVLTAVSSSARQLYSLLRCLSFADKAHVRISESAIFFSVDEARVMQARVALEKELFTAYQFHRPSTQSGTENNHTEDEAEWPSFQVSVPALLETLQIFGFADNVKDRWSSRDNYNSGVDHLAARGAGAAFDSRTLGMAGICRISYAGPGEPLCITMEEGNVTTTCDLVTYEPHTDMEDIPFGRDQLTQRVVMASQLLFDAVNELEATRPDAMSISTGAEAPHLSLSAVGDFGSVEVEFSKDTQLLESFRVGGRVTNQYKFSLVQSATRAMASAAKVSMRGDAQGVLSLQFLFETESSGTSFVDFVFVPLLDASDDESPGRPSEEGE